jgi:hypothetical protein
VESTQSAYVDSNGRPLLRASIVGFLDLLGFSNRVTSTAQTGESQELLDLIAGAISNSREFVRQVVADDSTEIPRGWSVKFFSDNLVLGYAFEDSNRDDAAAAWFVVRCVQQYQLRMSFNGLFLRGGLTSGPVCMTDEIIFGASLIECYELESKAAIVPRVLLSESLSKVLLDSYQGSDRECHQDKGNSICRDVDGWWFVNYLQAAVRDGRVDWDAIESHKQGILKSLERTSRHDVFPKFGWACRYHNMFCHWNQNDNGYEDRFRIRRDDDQSVICRLIETHPS